MGGVGRDINITKVILPENLLQVNADLYVEVVMITVWNETSNTLYQHRETN